MVAAEGHAIESTLLKKTYMTKTRWQVIVVFLVLLIVVGLSAVSIRGVGRWLVVADPLEHAQAIVVLSGSIPFRAMEAASIYRQGWASEVWLTKEIRRAQEEALAQLGISYVRGEVYNREVLERLGVPSAAIRVLNKGVRNTAEEVQLISRELKQAGANRVILVTSKPHTRRVRVIWRTLLDKNPEVIVRYAHEDPFNPERWWRNTKDSLAVSREVFGMMNVWAGFPVRAKRGGEAGGGGVVEGRK